jgi:16S rRNA C967 or C1407 C5-methylase (RsmB/RsmF family)
VLEWEGTKFSGEVSKVARVWPHHNNTDGFFLAKVRK